MQLYGGRYESAFNDGRISELPRLHLNDFWRAFITVYVVMDNENWDGVLYSHMAAFGGSASIYFLIVIFIGNFFMLNMFLSILVEVLLLTVSVASLRGLCLTFSSLRAGLRPRPHPGRDGVIMVNLS